MRLFRRRGGTGGTGRVQRCLWGGDSALPLPLGDPRSSIWGDPATRRIPENAPGHPESDIRARDGPSERSAAACRRVTWCPTLGEPRRGAPADRIVARTQWLPSNEGKEGFRDLWRRGGAGAGVPPFKPVFPAFAVRSSRVQQDGRKRRSCSPVCSYKISRRDSDLMRSACPPSPASPPAPSRWPPPPRGEAGPCGA